MTHRSRRESSLLISSSYLNRENKPFRKRERTPEEYQKRLRRRGLAMKKKGGEKKKKEKPHRQNGCAPLESVFRLRSRWNWKRERWGRFAGARFRGEISRTGRLFFFFFRSWIKTTKNERQRERERGSCQGVE